MCGSVLQLADNAAASVCSACNLRQMLLLLVFLRVALPSHMGQHTFHMDSVNFSTWLRLRSSATLVLLCSHAGCRQRHARGCQDTWEWQEAVLLWILSHEVSIEARQRC